MFIIVKLEKMFFFLNLVPEFAFVTTHSLHRHVTANAGLISKMLNNGQRGCELLKEFVIFRQILSFKNVWFFAWKVCHIIICGCVQEFQANGIPV